MKITVNVNIENSKRGWAAVANHVKHDPHQKHSNKDIEPELRSLNYLWTTAKYGVSNWQEDKFGTFVKAHDEKLKKQGRREKNRYYHSVQGFLGRKNRQTAVVTFGNNESWKELIRNFNCQEGVDYTVEHENKGNGNVYEWYKLNPQSERVQRLRVDIRKLFVRWHNSLNNDSVISKYMRIGRCAIHLDEHGAPHMHAEIAFCGRTKKGAPTPSMSTAIMQMVAEKTGITPKNNREAFREFRKITDERLIEKSPFVYKTGEPYFELIRTGRDTSRDMETYKATEDQRLADEKAKLEEVKQQRKVEEQRLEELKQQQEQQRQEMQQQRDEQQRQLESLSREKAQKEQELSAVQIQLEKTREALANVSKTFMRGVKRLIAYTRQSWLKLEGKPFEQSPKCGVFPYDEDYDTHPTAVFRQAGDLSDDKVVRQVVERIGGDNDDGYTIGMAVNSLESDNKGVSPYPKVAGKYSDVPDQGAWCEEVEYRMSEEREYGPSL